MSAERIAELERKLRARQRRRGFSDNTRDIETEIERLKGEANGG